MEHTKITNIVLLVCAGLMLLTSCSVQKRVYRKGYHIVWDHKKANEHKRPERLPDAGTHVIKDGSLKETVTASAETNENSIFYLSKKPVLVLGKDTCGDKLLLQNADELLVKILEIDDQVIRYKRCDNVNGPTYSIGKNKVALITYANGIKEVVMQEPPVKTTEPVVNEKYTGPKKNNLLGLVSLLSHVGASIMLQGAAASAVTGVGLVGIAILLGLAALVMAYVALFQFKNEPERYTGKWMPIVVICLDLALVLFSVLILSTAARLAGVNAGSGVLFLLVIFFVMLGLFIYSLMPKKEPPKYLNEK